jgi:hypothetical protein
MDYAKESLLAQVPVKIVTLGTLKFRVGFLYASTTQNIFRRSCILHE